ncbi:hypothetical protein F4801DRAFT_543160 [Xylaria longipes]|nr:hypothetical protein F4801DRAFT_543160 [Xylaria longipes]
MDDEESEFSEYDEEELRRLYFELGGEVEPGPEPAAPENAPDSSVADEQDLPEDTSMNLSESESSESGSEDSSEADAQQQEEEPSMWSGVTDSERRALNRIVSGEDDVELDYEPESSPPPSEHEAAEAEEAAASQSVAGENGYSGPRFTELDIQDLDRVLFGESNVELGNQGESAPWPETGAPEEEEPGSQSSADDEDDNPRPAKRRG